MKAKTRLFPLLCAASTTFVSLASLPLKPAIAAMPSTEQAQTRIELAGFGNFMRILERGQDMYEEHQENVREQEIHDAQMEERERKLRAYEEAQAAAAEATRQEAARRQALWESMTPQQRHAYVEEQRQAQARQDEAANLFMLGIGSALIEGMMTPDCRLYEGDYGRVYEVCN
ncbi:MAG: hypothetical protein AAFU53_14550 [Cyanobacteria bacterium J06632_3]